MGAHLTEDTLLDFAGGRLRGPPLEEATSHLDGCVECRRVMRGLGSIIAEPNIADGPTQMVEQLNATTDRVPSEKALGDEEPAPSGTVIGKALGRYLLLDFLGEGAMGTVYTAWDPVLKRKVALKLLKDERAEVGESRQRFLREAQTLARITHPNVVSVHDTGTWQGRIYIAMDFVEGGTVGQWLRKEPRDWRQILEVFKSAARGLAAAHSMGVVHRDFKPENVLIGADGRVAVTDFGLARGPSRRSGKVGDGLETEVEDELTSPGALVGTPAYMPPEQFRGRPADAKSDQFSFCVALYEALYRQRPFHGDDLRSLAHAVIRQEFQPLRDTRGVPRWLHRILIKGMSVAAVDRHESLNALLAAIESVEQRAVLFGPAMVRLFGTFIWMSLSTLAALLGDRAVAMHLPSVYLYALAAVALFTTQALIPRVRQYASWAIPFVDVPLIWLVRRQSLLPAAVALSRETPWSSASFSVSLFVALLAGSITSMDPWVVSIASALAICFQIELSHAARPDFPLGAAIHVAPLWVVGVIGAVMAYRLRALVRVARRSAP